MKRTIAGLSVLLAAAGCSSAETQTGTTPAPVAATDGNVETQPSNDANEGQDASATGQEEAVPEETTEETATPQQLASIIAGEQEYWVAVIDEAVSCRIQYVRYDEDDVLSSMEASLCYAEEVTMGVSASNAVRDLKELSPPTSMIDLLEETIEVLDWIANVDLEEWCGPQFDPPAMSDDCAAKMGSRNSAYRSLETTLAKWGPYL